MVENWDQYKDLEYYPDRVCGCGCEGRIKVRPSHRYEGIPQFIAGHHIKGYKIPRETRICGCGCEGTFECKVSSNQKYIYGHGSRGKHHTEETIEKICQAKLGKHPTEETIEKNRQAHLGKPSGMSGKHHSEETIEKMKGSHLGKSSGMLNKYHSEETIKKMKTTATKNWEDPEYREKQLKAIFKGLNLRPNKPEKLLIKLLQELFPNEYKYVGDGSILIGYKNPDFINVNGQKKIIEHFGEYPHGPKRTGRTNKEEEQQRINHFAKYGYQTLIIWEHELENLELTSEKILQFNKKVK
jgi:hypothetical protein